MLNRCVMIGRLTKDPELRTTTTGKNVATFTLAINRKFNKDETDFVDIVVWGASADNCSRYLSKGSMAAVDGRMQLRKYNTKDGQQRLAAEIIADDVRFLSTNKKESVQSAEALPFDDDAVGDDDLPF